MKRVNDYDLHISFCNITKIKKESFQNKEQSCKAHANVVFVIDVSTKMGKYNFENQIIPF